MKFRKSIWVLGIWALAFFLRACNRGATPAPVATQDVGAIQTQAFNTVLTQVALQNSPTPLPSNTPESTATPLASPTFAPIGGGFATNTPFLFNTPDTNLLSTPVASVAPTTGVLATVTTKNGCNDGLLVSESKPFDGAVMSPGETFEKVFQFLNVGSCVWDEGYRFAFLTDFSTPGFKGSDILIKKPEEFVKPGAKVTFSFILTANNKPGTYQGTWKMKDDEGNYFGSMVWVKYVINKP
ncbi:MAG: hypothetical protein HYZ23_05790 [Chloroflexi bacterium]|nr:hypothetical protein [Chloroflexota bacterium]